MELSLDVQPVPISYHIVELARTTTTVSAVWTTRPVSKEEDAAYALPPCLAAKPARVVPSV